MVGQARPWRPRTFEEWVSHAPLEYLLCWDSGHNFGDDRSGWIGEKVRWQKDGSVMLQQTCPRCGLPRDRYLGAQGDVDGSKNVYYYHRMTLHSYPYLFHGFEDGAFGMPVRSRRMRVRLEIRRRVTENRPKVASNSVVTPTFRGVQ